MEHKVKLDRTVKAVNRRMRVFTFKEGKKGGARRIIEIGLILFGI